MGTLKKILIGVLILAMVVGIAGAGLNQIKKGNQKEVMVTSVDGLASDYYQPSTSLDGNITTSVTQNITVDNDMIIEQLYVSKGDHVKKGDILISFDMTLVDMELNIAKLKHQKMESDLLKAQKRLNSLQGGGAVNEDDVYDSTGIGDGLSEDTSTLDTSSDNDISLSSLSVNDRFLATILRPMLLTALADDFGAEMPQDQDEVSEQPSEEDPADGSGNMPESSGDSALNYYEEGADKNVGEVTPGVESGFESDGGEPLEPQPTPIPERDPNYEYFDEEGETGDPEFTDGEAGFYQVLDENSEPYEGMGTKESPYVFLVSSAKGRITATGAFLNKMAGYNEDGTRIITEGGYWYLMEFHENDTIADLTDRKLSCTGYYLIDGSMLAKPVDRFASMEFSLDGASKYDDDDDDGGDDFPEIPYDNGGDGLSRSEAIKIQKKRIASLKLDIQESAIKIKKLEKKLAKQTIYSRLDGTVASVGDAVTGTNSESNYFMSVKSDDGFFVRGTVSELLLDQMQEGTVLNCTNYSYYDTGATEFQAEVIDVADYPVSSDSSNYYYYGDGNPNVSSYAFTASIPDKSISLQDGDYVSVMLAEEVSTKGIVLSRAFVRSEKGENYVYKDDNGTLKKQIVTIGGNVDGGSSVLVKSGIKRDDLIAFPYSKSAVEGAKTKKVNADRFYGY